MSHLLTLHLVSSYGGARMTACALRFRWAVRSVLALSAASEPTYGAS